MFDSPNTYFTSIFSPTHDNLNVDDAAKVFYRTLESS